MTTNEFIRKLDELFAAQEYEKVEPFMLSVLEEAKERDDYGLYLSVGNEMIGYYRSISQFRKAYQISEDMLLLMEELQMDQSAEFATVLPLLLISHVCLTFHKTQVLPSYRYTIVLYVLPKNKPFLPHILSDSGNVPSQCLLNPTCQQVHTLL